MAKVGNCRPPVETRFSMTNQPSNAGRKKGQVSMTTILRKILNKEMEFNDPFGGKTVKRSIYEIINLQLIAKAITGDIDAIKLVYNRIDGKQKGIDIHIGEKNINLDRRRIIIHRSPNHRPLKKAEAVDVNDKDIE